MASEDGISAMTKREYQRKLGELKKTVAYKQWNEDQKDALKRMIKDGGGIGSPRQEEELPDDLETGN